MLVKIGYLLTVFLSATQSLNNIVTFQGEDVTFQGETVTFKGGL